MRTALGRFLVPSIPPGASEGARLRARRTGFIRQLPIAATVMVPVSVLVPAYVFGALFGLGWVGVVVLLTIRIRHCDRTP
jgi:hypothetical protein